jgi:O-antigen/teichoic acid export membrane protein
MTQPVRRALVIYACAFAVAGVTPFLLLPLLTKQLTPTQFGEVTSFLILAALLGNLVGLSAHGFVAVRFFKTAADRFKTAVSSVIGTLGVLHVAAFAVVGLAHPLLERSLGLSLPEVLLAVVAALFLNLNFVFLAIFQSSSQPWRYLQSRVLQGSIELGLCLALLFLVAADASARTYSYTIALAASALMGWAYCAAQGRVGARVERAWVRDMLRFGGPLVPHIVAGTAITYMDRLVVTSMLGTERLGIYMVAMQFGMAMIALIEPLNKALAPWLFQQLARNDEGVRRMIVRRTYQIFLLLVVCGALLALAAHLLFDHLVAPEYADARTLIPWMVAGFVCQGMYYTQVNYLFFVERTGRLSMVTGATAVGGVLVSFALTRAYGLQGAGASFLINNLIMFLLVWLVASRAVPMPWRLAGSIKK